MNRQLTTTDCVISLSAPVFNVAALAAMCQAVVWYSWALEQAMSAFLPVKITSTVEHSTLHMLAWRRHCRIVR